MIEWSDVDLAVRDAVRQFVDLPGFQPGAHLVDKIFE